MLEKLQAIEEKFLDIERRMADPEVISNQKIYQEIVKKHAELEEAVLLYRRLKRVDSELAEAKLLLKDPDMREMAEQEVSALEDEHQSLHDEIQIYLLPSDPDDSKNVIMEIRSGTGGDEAALFAGELYRMYTRYAETRGWKIEVLSENLTGIGGVKEIEFSVQGTKAYRDLKFESGTHRVQRVPQTEASGRIHTSAATVAVLPEAEEVDIEIDTKDLRIDTFRASGAGGQHVNKTSSAIRITHEPSGVVVACQDERSQFQNKDKAMRMLRARLYEMAQKQKHAAESSLRKSLVGSGDRSEKIRTYNFPQSRVTDHRIGYTSHSLPDVLNGNLQGFIDALLTEDRVKRMQQ